MGNRVTYSQYCGELASHGYVVAAIEHRDGTAISSIVHAQDGTSRRQDYISPDDCKISAAAGSGKLPSLVMRSEQLQMRKAEIEHVMDELAKLTSDPESVKSLRPLPKDMSRWQNAISTAKETTTLAGHSFGGATVITLLKSSLASRFSKGVALDPWMDPIANEPSEWAKKTMDLDETPEQQPQDSAAEPGQTSLSSPSSPIGVPLLIQNSEQFTYDGPLASIFS